MAERLVYEWDENKRRTNRAKHGVDFAAMRAFDWETARIEAEDHPEEPRWLGRGVIGSRLHVVVFTERGNRIRIISLRKANPREEQRMPGNVDRDLQGLTFDEIAERYGEEAAIAAGIAADPDARELADGDFARMRPASEVIPAIVEAYRRTRGKKKAPVKEQITIRLDADVVAHFRNEGRGWQTRLNAVLRRAVFKTADQESTP